ncbi:MAG: SET domain-containing protein [Phycisphaerales bacterium]
MQDATDAPLDAAIRTTVLSRFDVVRIDGAAHLVATAPIGAGVAILELVGVVRPTPDRYSVQLDDGAHLHPPDEFDADDDRYFWRFLNHSCAPNAAFAGRTLVALRRIQAGDEITFDYNTTEADMATPFRCRCGHCFGRMIRGYLHESTR